MSGILQFLIVGIGGFAGSCLRYAFTKLCKNCSFLLPIGTLAANVLAGLLIGIFIGLDDGALPLPPRTKLLLTTGLCGGLSTFSAFSLETITLFGSGKYFAAILNIILNLGISLFAVASGLAIAKLLFKKT
ncbi:MAG: fluoride efflux transporter CrcB [Oscillospiraceae bacterium]